VKDATTSSTCNVNYEAMLSEFAKRKSKKIQSKSLAHEIDPELFESPN